MCRSPAAFATLYGLEGLIGSVSAAEPPPARSPYTSSVETWTKRAPVRRTSSSSTCVPKNSVRPKSVAPRIERSTCVSAAKLTIASQPSAASATAAASQMSAAMSSTPVPSRFAGFPE